MLVKLARQIGKYIPTTLIKRTHSPILLYHSLYKNSSSLNEFHDVSLDCLYSQLRNLSREFEFVELDEYVAAKNKKNLAVITFDDGYLSVLDIGLEVLEALSIPATIFVNTAFFNGGMFWRDKVRLILSHGLSKQFCIWVRNSKFKFDFDYRYLYKQSKSNVINSRILEKAIDSFFLEEKKPFYEMPSFINAKTVKFKNHKLITYGNHSQNHYVMSSLSDKEQFDEVNAFDDLFGNLDVKTSKVFSLPFGGNRDLNMCTISILKELNYSSILMSRGRLDTRYQSFYGFKAIDRIMPLDGVDKINLGLGYFLSFRKSSQLSN